MIIGGKEVSEILVRTKENALIVSITDKNVIVKNGYDVDLWPSAEKNPKKRKNNLILSTKRVQRKAPIPVH